MKKFYAQIDMWVRVLVIVVVIVLGFEGTHLFNRGVAENYYYYYWCSASCL